MRPINELIRLIDRDFKSAKFDKFIHDATFPNFKTLSPGAKVIFRFPLTLLVGPNGGGKSSILHGLWGMPLNYSTNRFWFSTAVDPISNFKNGRPNVPRYWYSHYVGDLAKIVQTRKVKGGKRLGYWEPSKPSPGDGMDTIPIEPTKSEYRSTDRWTPVQREVKYINTRTDTSAFDRFFYHAGPEGVQSRQETFIKEAKRLRKVIDGNLTSKRLGTGEFVFANFEIDPAHLKVINQIIGKRYISARYIIHRFYDRNKAPSVIFETASRVYSESFAGSGELSVVNLVLGIEDLSDYSLLLLDEPETSLHPGAQKELLNYILHKIYEKKLQVVVSTHSPSLVEWVPQEALVVLEHDEEGVTIRTDVHKSAAFYRLGQPDPSKIVILTEDVLLKAMIERSLELLEASLRKKCEVIAVNQGVSEMLSHQVPTMLMTNAKAIMVLDGDQQPFMDEIDVDIDDLSPKGLDRLIAKIKAKNVNFVGQSPDLVGCINWCKKRVKLIDEKCAEEVFLSILDPSHPKLGKASNTEFKSALRGKLKGLGNETDSHAVAVMFKLKLGEVMRHRGPAATSLKNLADRIKNALIEVGH